MANYVCAQRTNYFRVTDVEAFEALTRREQEIPHLYRWWDELRLTRRPV